MASGGEPQRFCDPSEMVQLYAHLGKGELSPETVELHGLRVVHRQRFGKHLQFVGLRCPLGTSVEAILKGGVFEPAPNVELASAFRLGDVVSVTGQVEMSECRLSVKAQKAEVLESWQALFGKQVFHDFWLSGTDADANVLVQCCSSHAARLSEYLQVLLGLKTIAMVAPLSGRGGREERGLLLNAPEPAALFAKLREDPSIARVVRRWYLLGSRHATVADAVGSLVARLRAERDRGHPPAFVPSQQLRRVSIDQQLQQAAAAGRPFPATDAAINTACAGAGAGAVAAERVPVRLHCFPRSLEKPITAALEQGGYARPSPQGEAVLCVAYVQGAFSAGLSSATALGVSGDNALAARPQHAAVSRAFYKLQEVGARCDLRLSRAADAIDVGASPGGWSVFLAERCRSVVAVDPGLLRLPDSLPSTARIEHLPMLLERALPLLRARRRLRPLLLRHERTAARGRRPAARDAAAAARGRAHRAHLQERRREEARVAEGGRRAARAAAPRG